MVSIQDYKQINWENSRIGIIAVVIKEKGRKLDASELCVVLNSRIVQYEAISLVTC